MKKLIEWRSIERFIGAEPTKTDQFDMVAELLRSAATHIEYAKENHPDDIDSAAWRAADALLIMSELVPGPKDGYPPIIGIDLPTGRGAKLSKGG